MARKILVLVNLMALTIYAKADLLRPMPRPRTCSRKAKAKNFGLKAKAKD